MFIYAGGARGEDEIPLSNLRRMGRPQNAILLNVALVSITIQAFVLFSQVSGSWECTRLREFVFRLCSSVKSIGEQNSLPSSLRVLAMPQVES